MWTLGAFLFNPAPSLPLSWTSGRNKHLHPWLVASCSLTAVGPILGQGGARRGGQGGGCSTPLPWGSQGS